MVSMCYQVTSRKLASLAQLPVTCSMENQGGPGDIYLVSMM